MCADNIGSNARIESLADIEQIIEQVEKEFFNGSDAGGRDYDGYLPIWFRGHSDYSGSPLPSIYRPAFRQSCNNALVSKPEEDKIRQREYSINRNFRRLAYSSVDNPDDFSLLYYLGQHHGLPTRLLDWTINAFVALYFAIGDKCYWNIDGYLYMMNARTASSNGGTYDWDSPTVTKVSETLFKEIAPLSELNVPRVIPILMPKSFGRIRDQHSCFTLHTHNLDCNPFCKNGVFIRKYIIPANSKQKLFLMLKRIGVSRSYIFGDLENITKEVKESFGIN